MDIISSETLPIKNWASSPEEGTLEQAKNLANHPAVIHWVSLMPDAHPGMGMPIGGVVCFDGVVCPNAVGVDIGCGMLAWETGCPLESFLEVLEPVVKKIKYLIPTGFHHRQTDSLNSVMESFIEKLHNDYDEATFWDRAPVNIDGDARSQIATLGGGNHFIEIQADTPDRVWVMIHSGSRNIGKQVGTTYHHLAQERNEQWKSQLNMPELAYLAADSNEGQEYISAMNFCLDFADANRRSMLSLVKEAFSEGGLPTEGDPICIHHNYASVETHFKKTCWVHRKGATRARSGELGIIPGSMGTSSYIVRGLGNPQSFHSCSHGAGRRMGRLAAKRAFGLREFEKAMSGIHFRPSKSTLDESPMAYKDIEEVMDNQSDLVEIAVKLRPIVPLKDESR